MAIYYINIAMVCLWGFILHKLGQTKKTKLGFIIVCFTQFFLLYALRDGIGWDYPVYTTGFSEITANSFIENWTYSGWEIGYVFINKMVALATNNHYIFIAVTALIILIPAAWFIYTYSKDIWLSTFLYVTLIFLYAGMNFIRQTIAFSITLIAYKFLMKRKPIPYILIILLASLFHKTVLIMIPIYFIVNILPTAKRLVIYAILVMIAFFTSDVLVKLVTQFVYKSYQDSVYLTGISIKFWIVPLFFVAIALIFKKQLLEQSRENAILINMTIIYATFFIFVTKFVIFERLSVYQNIFVVLLIPEILSILSKKSTNLTKKAKKNTDLSDNQYYYIYTKWTVVVMSLLYNIMGMYDVVGGFHGVFPYQSIFH